MAETIILWEPECESPYVDAADSINTWEMFANGESRAPTPSMMKELQPVKVERAFSEGSNGVRLHRIYASISPQIPKMILLQLIKQKQN